MGNVKKNNYYLIIAVFFTVSYITFLIFDQQEQNQQKQKEFQQKLQQFDRIGGSNIEAFIFGGSNALNSLSALQLTQATGIRYHNASMNSEMRSDINYNNFILSITSMVNKNNIKVIIYSSILPYATNSIENHINGQPDNIIKIIPSMSIIGYLKKYLMNNLYTPQNSNNETNKDESIYNTFGDYTNLNLNCFYNNYSNKFNPETILNSSIFLVNKSHFLANNFPNSKIYIVLPSLYYGLPTPSFSIYTTKLKESFNRNLSLTYPELVDRVTLIIQPFYPNVNYVCNDPHHATAIGRAWRTNELLRSMRDIKN
jgi:hypothetical protein